MIGFEAQGQTGQFITSTGSGPPVLLIHGLPTNHRLWDRFIPYLQTHFRCITLDLPGFGESPPRRDGSLNPDRYADGVEAVRSSLNIARWHVIGHDAGSAVAIHYAARYPDHVDRLVLSSAPIFPEHCIPWFFRPLRTPTLGEILAPVASGLIFQVGLSAAIRDAPDRHALVESFQQPFLGRAGAKRLLHILRWGDPKAVLARTAALLPKIRTPTLLLHGLRDRAIPPSFASRAAHAMPDAVAFFAEASHFLPLNEPHWMAARIIPFLSGALASGPHADGEPFARGADV